MSYSPTLGRWLERDPAGYVDGANLYEALNSDPIGYVDPMGLQAGNTTTQPVAQPGGGNSTTQPVAQPPQVPFPQFPGDDRKEREAFARAMVNYYNNWAQNNKKCCLIDAQTLVAQWMMESNWGRSKLVQATYNFGNIKGTGTAGTTKADTKENINGQDVTVNAGFRKYHNPNEFFADYNDLICNNPRYKNAKSKFGREYFQALKDAGYATDPDYVDKAMKFYDQLGFN